VNMKTKQGGYEITETGLVVREGWTPELWEAAGHEIARYQKGLMWLIGDWLNAGDREGYVERGRLAEACERFGIAYSTAAQATRVSAAFPESCNRLQHLPMPDGVYRVIYADPPWQYGDARTNDAQSGSAESQYPTMPIDEICAMPVRDMAAQDSVLFLWATAPCLPEAMRVIEAWGFTYKAQFVWDKQKGFNGHYNDVRHELLLIATRGSCVPAVDTLDPSVIAEKRTKHSKKPDRFYELIERLYPLGDSTHVELFARRSRDGWQSWGNQVDAAAR